MTSKHVRSTLLCLEIICLSSLLIGESVSAPPEPRQQLDSTDSTAKPEVVTYEYAYDIGSQYHNENKDSNGVVRGEWGHISPDGWFKIYNYTADKNGYRVSRRRLRGRQGGVSLSGGYQTGQGRPTAASPTANQPGAEGAGGAGGVNLGYRGDTVSGTASSPTGTQTAFGVRGGATASFGVGGRGSPGGTGSGSQTTGTGSGTLPGGTGSGSLPATGTGSGSSPIGTGSGSSPVGTGSGSSPDGTGSGSSPVGTGSGSSPVSTGSGSSPVGTGIGSSAGGAGSGSSAVETGYRPSTESASASLGGYGNKLPGVGSGGIGISGTGNANTGTIGIGGSVGIGTTAANGKTSQGSQTTSAEASTTPIVYVIGDGSSHVINETPGQPSSGGSGGTAAGGLGLSVNINNGSTTGAGSTNGGVGISGSGSGSVENGNGLQAAASGPIAVTSRPLSGTGSTSSTDDASIDGGSQGNIPPLGIYPGLVPATGTYPNEYPTASSKTQAGKITPASVTLSATQVSPTGTNIVTTSADLSGRVDYVSSTGGNIVRQGSGYLVITTPTSALPVYPKFGDDDDDDSDTDHVPAPSSQVTSVPATPYGNNNNGDLHGSASGQVSVVGPPQPTDGVNLTVNAGGIRGTAGYPAPGTTNGGINTEGGIGVGGNRIGVGVNTGTTAAGGGYNRFMTSESGVGASGGVGVNYGVSGSGASGVGATYTPSGSGNFGDGAGSSGTNRNATRDGTSGVNRSGSFGSNDGAPASGTTGGYSGTTKSSFGSAGTDGSRYNNGAGNAADGTTNPGHDTRPGFYPLRYDVSSEQPASGEQSCPSKNGASGFPKKMPPLGVARNEHQTNDGKMEGKYTLTFPMGYVMEISYNAYQDPALAAQYISHIQQEKNCQQ